MIGMFVTSVDGISQKRQVKPMAEGLTLYKLIVLYMLRKVNFPLSNTQITEFMIDKEYTDYFHVQQALHDLVDTKLVTVETIRNSSRYTATSEGEKTLEYFSAEISYPIKREIDQYLKENAYELRNKSCMLADYSQTADGGYEVVCRVVEGREVIFSITLSVPAEQQADRICEKWQEAAPEVYAAIMEKLL